MRFRAVPVHNFEDVTLNLEQLQTTLTTPGTALPFLQLLTAGARTVAFGTATCTFTAASTTPVVTTAHGLPRAPAVVLMQLTAGGTLVNFVGATVTGSNATNFTWNGWYSPGGANTGTATFNWLAIG